MNYLAHGIRFLDRPYVLAGTAVPDWLSVADRPVRLREKHVRPVADDSRTVPADVAAGVLQHLEDDRWFHRTPAFFETTGRLTRLFRDALGPDDGYRPGFLGHIMTEMILDGVLAERHSGLLDDYYRALNHVDAGQVQRAVNGMAPAGTDRLAGFIVRFREARFLEDYLEPDRLLFRLNQVLGRIKLKPLPEETTTVLPAAWETVKSRADQLLPDECFQWSQRNPVS